MAAKPKIALIIGSTRPTRFADIPAAWMLKQATARGDMDVDVLGGRQRRGIEGNRDGRSASRDRSG